MEDIKRVRYFEYEFLDADDFNDEQNYHCQMRRMHNRDFHTWGIGHGLEVNFAEGQEKGEETKVTVSPGTAVDGQGREIVLAISKTIDFNQPGYEPGKSYYVTIKWQEQPGLPAQKDELKRWEEVPYIDTGEGFPEEPEITLVLTKVTLKENRIIAAIDHSDRRYATLELGDDTVTSSKIVKADGTTGQDTTLGEGIKTAHIQDNAVTTPKLANGSVTETKLDSTTRAKLVTNGNNHDHAGGDGAKIKHSSLDLEPNIRNPHGITASDVGAATESYVNKLLVGCVAAFAMTTPPDGWLECNGQQISRTHYARLFSRIGLTFGPGNGSTTFNVPDLRGEFIRGWDSRQVGDAIDPGRSLGSRQNHQIQSHKHEDSGHPHGQNPHSHASSSHTHGQDSHNHGLQMYGGYTAGDWRYPQHTTWKQPANWVYTSSSSPAIHGAVVSISAAYASIKDGYARLGNPEDSNSGAGEPLHGNETRPANIALMYCIKY